MVVKIAEPSLFSEIQGFSNSWADLEFKFFLGLLTSFYFLYFGLNILKCNCVLKLCKKLHGFKDISKNQNIFK